MGGPLRFLIWPAELKEIQNLANVLLSLQFARFPTRWCILDTLAFVRCGVLLYVCTLLFDKLLPSVKMSGPRKRKVDRER